MSEIKVHLIREGNPCTCNTTGFDIMITVKGGITLKAGADHSVTVQPCSSNSGIDRLKEMHNELRNERLWRKFMSGNVLTL
jgi:hypothetical protein